MVTGAQRLGYILLECLSPHSLRRRSASCPKLRASPPCHSLVPGTPSPEHHHLAHPGSTCRQHAWHPRAPAAAPHSTNSPSPAAWPALWLMGFFGSVAMLEFSCLCPGQELGLQRPDRSWQELTPSGGFSLGLLLWFGLYPLTSLCLVASPSVAGEGLPLTCRTCLEQGAPAWAGALAGIPSHSPGFRGPFVPQTLLALDGGPACRDGIVQCWLPQGEGGFNFFVLIFFSPSFVCFHDFGSSFPCPKLQEVRTPLPPATPSLALLWLLGLPSFRFSFGLNCW
ncbi:unnamed protein product [Lepidochelys olivacea]